MSWRADLRQLVTGVADEELHDLVGELARANSVVRARLLPQRSSAPAHREPDTYLSAEDVAECLGMSPKFVYANRDQLGGVKLGTAVRFSQRAVDRYLAKSKTI